MYSFLDMGFLFLSLVFGMNSISIIIRVEGLNRGVITLNNSNFSSTLCSFIPMFLSLYLLYNFFLFFKKKKKKLIAMDFHPF